MEKKSKGTERVNEEGAIETKVDTIDIQSPPGENKEPKVENVGVVHLTHDRPNTGNKGGVLAGAAEAATKAVQAVKDSMSGSNK